MSEERDRGQQPVAALMKAWSLSPHDLVEASPDQLTHKQVQRACKGRMLTLAMMQKVTRALNIAAGRRLGAHERDEFVEYQHRQLFNYAKGHDPAFEDPNAGLRDAGPERTGL